MMNPVTPDGKTSNVQYVTDAPPRLNPSMPLFVPAVRQGKRGSGDTEYPLYPSPHSSMSNLDPYLTPFKNKPIFPSLAEEPEKQRFASPRHAFIPVSYYHGESSGSEKLLFASDKTSPTTTAVSFDQIMSSPRRQTTPYMPATPNSTSTGMHIASPVWVAPRSNALCQFIHDENTYNKSYKSAAMTTPSKKHHPSVPLAASSPSPTTRKQLFSPQRDESDPVRRSRIKTELCLHYINKNVCPFGVNCTYAHGEEELQLTTLLDLDQAGLVDMKTYRTVPCLTYVSTGSCPFGKRCHALHDPRVAGTEQSWLPHTETQGNILNTDINVDALHQKRLYSTLNNNPFGATFATTKNFDDLYNLVCNIGDATKAAPIQRSKKSKNKIVPIEPLHKLSIALQMRGGSNFQFKFRPHNIIFGELCMIIQKRAFRLTKDEAVEIPLYMHNCSNPKHVVVREIAFGPDCDPSVRGVALWFNVADSDVVCSTTQQAKRYRWKRGLNNKKPTTAAARDNLVKFDTLQSFRMIRPADRDSYGLSTAILDHRLAVLKAKRICNICERAIALERLETKREALAECFDGLVLAWNTWAWPVTKGRDEVDESTPVPAVDAEYQPIDAHSKDKNVGAATVQLWDSFVSADLGTAEKSHENQDDSFDFPTTQDLEDENSRLGVFKHLAEGASLPCNNDDVPTALPHITDTNDGFEDTGANAVQSRRCWKSLLLKPASGYEYSEWDLVSQHFQNSRSRKVLAILQQ